MDGERIFGIIIMIICNLMCGGVFVGMGIWAKKRKDPMHFYSGTSVDPKKVTDIPAYNRANARMWFAYSMPFWLSCVVSFFHLGAAAMIMGVACVPGFLWLIFRYQKICKTYMIPKS